MAGWGLRVGGVPFGVVGWGAVATKRKRKNEKKEKSSVTKRKKRKIIKRKALSHGFLLFS